MSGFFCEWIFLGLDSPRAVINHQPVRRVGLHEIHGLLDAGIEPVLYQSIGQNNYGTFFITRLMKGLHEGVRVRIYRQHGIGMEDLAIRILPLIP